jgi:hypothetical protein
LVGANQCTAFDLVQCVFQFRHAVARVQIDQDQAGLGGRILAEHPLDPVRRPQTNPVAGDQAKRNQTSGEPVDLLPQCRAGGTAFEPQLWPVAAPAEGLLPL